MTEFAWLDPAEQRIFRAYAKAARALFVQFDRQLQAEVGLPRTYFEILWLLDAAPGGEMRMSDLAAATGSQASRITYAVSRLEAAGQVRRELCPEDRRGWYTVITDAGREMLSRAAPHYAAMVRRYFLEPLSPRQREQVVEVGEVILGQLALSTPGAATAGAGAPGPFTPMPEAAPV